MNKMTNSKSARVSACLVMLVMLVSMTSDVQGQALSKPIKIDCVAFGTQTQMGKTFNVKIIINEFSEPSDRDILLEAFKKAGNQGVYNAVTKMQSKGRLSMPGTVGYDVNYVREITSASGRTIRMVTNRPISIGEVWSNSRSKGYDLSIIEINLSNDKDTKPKGTLLPAARLRIDKKTGEIELETYKFPWRLDNVVVWGEK
ncbi:MAG: hypothetical protein U0V70_21765 [Terriglobia bacterium]